MTWAYRPIDQQRWSPPPPSDLPDGNERTHRNVRPYGPGAVVHALVPTSHSWPAYRTACGHIWTFGGAVRTNRRVTCPNRHCKRLAETRNARG